jgi:hypothetical protein
MKTRAGFVSNSSSSSFCMVGFRVDIENEDDWEILKKVGFLPEDARMGDKDVDTWVDQGVSGTPKGFLVMGSDAPCMVGLDAEGYLADDWRLSQIKERLEEMLREEGVMNVTTEGMYLDYGEAGSG